MKSKAHPTWFAFVSRFVKVFFFLPFGGLKSVGRENIPKTGQVLIAPNHMSNADPPAVACGGNRSMRFMSKEELFRSPFSPIFRSLGAFPVKRGEGDTEAIRLSLEMLESGEALVVFPEGVRGEGNQLGKFTRGVAMLAKRTQAPIVPVGIIGTDKMLGRGKSIPRFAPVKIVYGEPFYYADVATGASEKENRELFTAALESKIIALCASQGKVVTRFSE